MFDNIFINLYTFLNIYRMSNMLANTLLLKALADMPIALVGHHPTKKFAERLGLRRKSIIPHMRKVVQHGSVESIESFGELDNKSFKLYLHYKGSTYPCVIRNAVDGVKTLYPKTVLTSLHINEQPMYKKGRYVGKAVMPRRYQ